MVVSFFVLTLYCTLSSTIAAPHNAEHQNGVSINCTANHPNGEPPTIPEVNSHESGTDPDYHPGAMPQSQGEAQTTTTPKVTTQVPYQDNPSQSQGMTTRRTMPGPSSTGTSASATTARVKP